MTNEKCQKISRGFNLEVQRLVQRSWRFDHSGWTVVGAVGTVGNSTFFDEFSKRCGGSGKNVFWFFHCLHGAAVSMARLRRSGSSALFEKYFIRSAVTKALTRPVVQLFLDAAKLSVCNAGEIVLLGKVLAN